MTLLELAKQYRGDVETRINKLKNSSDMGISEHGDEIAHWESTLRIINSTIRENAKTKSRMRAACEAVMLWAKTPGDHGGNPYLYEFVKLAERALK